MRLPSYSLSVVNANVGVAFSSGEPGFTTDKYDFYIGLDGHTNQKFFGSSRYWLREISTGSAVRVVEGSGNGDNYIELKSQHLSLAT